MNHQNVLLQGPAMFAWAVVAWAISAGWALLYLTDSGVTNQLMSGGPGNGLGWMPWVAVVAFLAGTACAVAATRKGPKSARRASHVAQFFVGLPALLLSGISLAFATML